MKIAIVDGASFVLPYDHELARLLVGTGSDVAFHGSRTSYNASALDAMRGLRGVGVFLFDISRTVAPRWRGLVNYARLWLGVVARRRSLARVNLQFSIVWPLEVAAAWFLRGRFVYTVHNAVPHGSAQERHGPTLRLATLARTLIFPSRHTHDDFMRRYGEAFRAKARLVPHGPVPAVPGWPMLPYRPPAAPQALVFWSNVKPYKGVELFAELARSPAWRERGLGLEIHGAWDASMLPLRDELAAAGVVIVDRFLGHAELLELLARPVVFVLPYREATQSGALYTLLHHGCYFLCTEVGDLGDFMRRASLESLLLAERSVRAVLACLDALLADPECHAEAFASARDAAVVATADALAAAYAA